MTRSLSGTSGTPATTFRISRDTGTHGDVLAAVGLADLLQSALQPGQTVRLRAEGAHITVESSEPVDPARIPPHPGYPYLRPNSRTPVPNGITDFIDYDAEKQKVDRYNKARAKANRRRAGAEVEQLAAEDQPLDDWRLLQVLNVLQGDETSNRVHEAIIKASRAEFQAAVAQGLRALIAGRPSGVEWPVSSVQLFSPNAAKGYSRLKPDSTGRNDKTKEQWVEPFVEWLKYRGYFRVACPFFEDGNIRLLCPVPGNIAVTALGAVAAKLRRVGLYGGPPKLDALAVLRLAELLIRHSEDYGTRAEEPIPGLRLAGSSPGEIVPEITVTHYQSLGNARAISAMFSLMVPAWFPIGGAADAKVWLDILDEHQRVVRGLRDDHSDEIGLLIRYRRFLERRGPAAAWEFVEFLEHYGPFVIRAREQKRRVRSFRTDLVGRVIMSNGQHLAEILDDPGFRAVAAAVRRATVNAQAQKAMGQKDYREIRYDLLHDLRRKRSLPGSQLVEAVSDFVSLYNSENARRREMGQKAPRNVTTDEFAGFAALVEKHGPSLVGALLCAYGSCREPRDPETAEDATEELSA